MPEVGGVAKLAVEHSVIHPRASAPGHPIGIFDSGVGGLTVLAEVMRQLPDEDVIYLADTARVPYGSRPPEEIIKINFEIFNYLIKQGAKMIIIACGTSSAVAYPKIKDKYKIPIIEMIGPGSRAALSATKNKKIGVIATQNTVDSGAYQDRLIDMNKEVQVIAEACPLFVPLIEGGFIETIETRKVAEEYLKPLIKQKVDTLILGCTHYPHLEKVINGIIKAKLVNPAVEVAREARAVLAKNHLLKNSGGRGHYAYYTTGNPSQFEILGSKLLNKPVSGVRQVIL